MKNRIEESWSVYFEGFGPIVINEKDNKHTKDEAKELGLEIAKNKNPNITMDDFIKIEPNKTPHKTRSYAKKKKEYPPESN